MFVDDCLVVVGGNEVTKDIVYARYRKWCEDTGHKPLASNKLSHELHERGFVSARTRDGRCWKEIGILVDAGRSQDSYYEPTPY
jgi:phage/plasmid-associated DNA primase